MFHSAVAGTALKYRVIDLPAGKIIVEGFAADNTLWGWIANLKDPTILIKVVK